MSPEQQPDPKMKTLSKKVKVTLPKVKVLKHHQEMSVGSLSIFVIVFAAIGYLIFRSFAASPVVATLEAEQMKLPNGASVISDSSASGGKAVLLAKTGAKGWANVTGSVNFPSSVTSMSVVAKQDYCNGDPYMKVTLDGVKVWGGFIRTNSWSSYSTSFSNAYKAGTHSLEISITNDYGKYSCDVNRYLDVTDFYGPTTVTPAPTVALSASPASVTAGQSSTLTWTSTNANSCTASGAWSGAEPASGSLSTGALNQTSTYSLTCTGGGGNASASATVTVSSSPPTIAISASPSSITSGQSSTLTWSSTNASTCTASGAWSGTLTTSGNKSVSPTATSTYGLTCTGSSGSATASATVTVSSSSGGTGLPLGSLLFGDEFNGASGSEPSSTLWSAKTYTSGASGCPFTGWNLVHEDGSGNLVMGAQKNSSGTGWLCSSISGKTGYSGQRYVEARAKVACGYGVWNAPVWEWAYPYGSGGLEVDESEQLGRQPSVNQVHLHNWTVSPQQQAGGGVTTSSTLCNGFHTYGAAIYSDHADFYVDGTKMSSITASQIGLSSLTSLEDVANIDLNMGGWGGTPTISGPVSMLVDYIHVYRLN